MRAQGPGLSSIALPCHNQEVGWEVEQLAQEPGTIWDISARSRDKTPCQPLDLQYMLKSGTVTFPGLVSFLAWNLLIPTQIGVILFQVLLKFLLEF